MAVVIHTANMPLLWCRRAALQLWGTSDKEFRAVQLTPAAAGNNQQAASVDQPTLAAAWHSSNQTLLNIAKVRVHVGALGPQGNSSELLSMPLCRQPAAMHTHSPATTSCELESTSILLTPSLTTSMLCAAATWHRVPPDPSTCTWNLGRDTQGSYPCLNQTSVWL
jgi:hypothetical protein